MIISLNKKINRYQIVSLLKTQNNIGIELGVAEGNFSEKMLLSNKFKLFYGIDSYSEFQHNDDEFIKTKNRLAKYKNYTLIRKNFSEALKEFNNNYFDFIYIDGFAHSGNDGGKTLFDWSHKLKIGGILSGDDYHDDWPLVKETVNEFINQTGNKLTITSITKDNPYSKYPSWYIIKNKEFIISLPKKLYDKGLSSHEKEIIRKSKISINFKFYIYEILKRIFGKKIVSKISKFIKKLFN